MRHTICIYELKVDIVKVDYDLKKYVLLTNIFKKVPTILSTETSNIKQHKRHSVKLYYRQTRRAHTILSLCL